MQTVGSRHTKVAGGDVARKPGHCARPAGTRPPRSARHSRQTDCRPAPRGVTPTGKRKQLTQCHGFSMPGHPLSVARHLYSLACAAPIRQVANPFDARRFRHSCTLLSQAEATRRKDRQRMCNMRHALRLMIHDNGPLHADSDRAESTRARSYLRERTSFPPVLEEILYLRRELSAPTPPAATAIATADVAVDSPRIDTAPTPTTALAGAAVPPVPSATITATAIAPMAMAHATFPVAFILTTFLARSPSISIVSSSFLSAAPRSFSLLTAMVTLFLMMLWLGRVSWSVEDVSDRVSPYLHDRTMTLLVQASDRAIL